MGKPKANQSRLKTIEEYAAFWNVGVSTVWQWIKDGKLAGGRHYVRKGKIIRFFTDEELIRELHEPQKPRKKKKIVEKPRNENKIDLTY